MSTERSRSSTWPSYPAVKCRTVMIGTWWLNSRRTISDPETIKDHSEDAVHDGNQHQAADDGACGGFADGAGAALGLKHAYTCDGRYDEAEHKRLPKPADQVTDRHGALDLDNI